MQDTPHLELTSVGSEFSKLIFATIIICPYLIILNLVPAKQLANLLMSSLGGTLPSLATPHRLRPFGPLRMKSAAKLAHSTHPRCIIREGLATGVEL